MKETEIADLRKSLKMTQKEFADFCGVTDRTVQKWEGGSPIPPLVRKLFGYIEAESNSPSVSVTAPVSGSAVGDHATNAAPDGLLAAHERLVASNESLIAELSAQREAYTRQIDRLIGLLEAGIGGITKDG